VNKTELGSEWYKTAAALIKVDSHRSTSITLTVEDLIHMLQELGHTYRPPVRPCDVEETMSRVWRDRT
jgi:hypothetical protein